eukprot:49729_1
MSQTNTRNQYKADAVSFIHLLAKAIFETLTIELGVAFADNYVTQNNYTYVNTDGTSEYGWVILCYILAAVYGILLLIHDGILLQSGEVHKAFRWFMILLSLIGMGGFMYHINWVYTEGLETNPWSLNMICNQLIFLCNAFAGIYSRPMLSIAMPIEPDTVHSTIELATQCT